MTAGGMLSSISCSGSPSPGRRPAWPAPFTVTAPRLSLRETLQNSGAEATVKDLSGGSAGQGALQGRCPGPGASAPGGRTRLGAAGTKLSPRDRP